MRIVATKVHDQKVHRAFLRDDLYKAFLISSELIDWRKPSTRLLHWLSIIGWRLIRENKWPTRNRLASYKFHVSCTPSGLHEANFPSCMVEELWRIYSKLNFNLSLIQSLACIFRIRRFHYTAIGNSLREISPYSNYLHRWICSGCIGNRKIRLTQVRGCTVYMGSRGC